MRDSVSTAPFEDIAHEDIEKALTRIFAEDGFVKSPALAAFLRFVVEETLAGRGGRLKAFTIATQALQRREDFDPQTQSIVRVQAKRLRELLDAYYAGPGAADPIVIALPLGTYRPSVTKRRDVAAPAPEPARLASPKVDVDDMGPVWARRLLLFAGLSQGYNIMVAVIVAAALLFWLGADRLRLGASAQAPIHGPPSLVVIFPASATDAQSPPGPFAAIRARLQTRIESGLNNFDYFRTRHGSPESGPDDSADYALLGSVMQIGESLEVEMRFQRISTGELIWSRRWPGVHANDMAAADDLARTIVSAVGDVGGGVMFGEVRARIAREATPQEGYACVIRAKEFIRDRDYRNEQSVLSCLDAQILAHPQDVMALTTLSSILLAEYINALPGSRGMADLQRALQLARRAYDLAPQRATSLGALFSARFYDKRFDDAFELAPQILAMAGESSLLTERISRAYIARGDYAEGLAHLKNLGAGLPASSAALFTLAALMRADRDGAYNYARRQPSAATPLGLVARIVACHEHDDEVCAAEAILSLHQSFPGFARDVPAALERHGLIEPIQQRLLKGLAEAGFKAPVP